MEMILKFNDEDPEDVVKHKRMLEADNLCHILYDVDNKLRSITKHWDSNNFTEDNVLEIVNEMRELIYEAKLDDIYS